MQEVILEMSHTHSLILMEMFVCTQASAPKKKAGRRKRKSAEEKAANVRARNRRAQQVTSLPICYLHLIFC